jgi:TPP-dependent pyruvate/acetoin dehydrogenase alpha subunit
MGKTGTGDDLLPLYETMLLIRRTEERLSSLFAAGEIPGFIHLSIGQEAVAAGVVSALEPADTIASNHRGHGHGLAKGIELDRFFLELLAKEGGCCGGRGGSMHVADLSVGMLGANGIVGAGVPIALGSALAHKIRGTGAIAAVFFGDGALAEGVLHETLNMASLWKLPFLAVCENNGWAEFSATSTQFIGDLHALGAAFKIPTSQVDGNDVGAVAAAAKRIVREIREGQGPQILECVTSRVHGHFEGDAQKYRAKDEIDALGSKDPIVRARAALMTAGVHEDRLDELDAAVGRRLDAAIAAARAAPEPDFRSALRDVYTPESV